MDPGYTVRQSEMRFHQSEITSQRPRVRTPAGGISARAHRRRDHARLRAPTGAGTYAEGSERRRVDRCAHGSQRAPRYWSGPRVALSIMHIARRTPRYRPPGQTQQRSRCNQARQHEPAHAPTGRSERRRVRQPTPKGASADGRSSPPGGAPTGSERPRERPLTGGSAQVQRVSSAPRKRKARQHQPAHVPPGHAH